VSKSIIIFIFLLTITATSSAKEEDIPAFIKETQAYIQDAKAQTQKYTKEKGYDPEAKKLLKETTSELQLLETKLQGLRKTPGDLSLIKERLILVKDNLIALGEIVPAGPQHFPKRCLILTLDSKGRETAMKEALELKVGRIETDSKNGLSLKVIQAETPEKVDQFKFDKNVGIIGSEDITLRDTILKGLLKDTQITAWVDYTTNTVMCISKPKDQDASPTSKTPAP